MKIPFSKAIFGEEEKKSLLEAFSSDSLIEGPRSKELEAAFKGFTGAPHAVALSSCTAAIHLSLFYLGVGPGDEVIVPALAHPAAASAVEVCGAKPVFVDAEPRTGNVDLERVDEKVTPRTKAVAVAHHLGMPVDMDRVAAIAQRHNLFVVEDCAQALGSYYKTRHVGFLGDVGCFSFDPMAHVTTVRGGMLTSAQRQPAERIALQRSLGLDRAPSERALPGSYDMATLGLSYSISELSAAIGIEQMKRLPRLLKRRKENLLHLEKALRDIEGLSLFRPSDNDYQSGHYALAVILSEKLASKRYEIVSALGADGVSSHLLYPSAVPHLTYFRDKYGYSFDHFPVARTLCERSFALPVGPHLGIEQMDYMVRSVKKAVSGVGSA